MANSASDDRISVVAVIGNQARVYGPLENGMERRPLRSVHEFPHNGAAREFADEFEEAERGRRINRERA